VPAVYAPVAARHDSSSGHRRRREDPHLWVYDKETGAMLAEIPLPANATGSPITYMTVGKQCIVFPVGGGSLVEELIAIALM